MQKIEVPKCFGSMDVFSSQSRTENGCETCSFDSSCKHFYVKTKSEIKAQIEQDKQYLTRFDIQE